MVQVLIPLVVIAACVLIRVNASVALSVNIARPPHEVFGYIANPLNVPRFNRRVREVRHTELNDALQNANIAGAAVNAFDSGTWQTWSLPEP